MNIAVLFDGAGLARLGLEQAGHNCTGYEIDPCKHYMSLKTGSGNCILADATKVDLSEYDAVWASPPCQEFSRAKTQGPALSSCSGEYIDWCLSLPHSVLWVENVVYRDTSWGKIYNAAQFLQHNDGQNRCRIIGGRYKEPQVFWPYRRTFKNHVPTITATEYKGHAVDLKRASRYFGRRLTIGECAKYQGLDLNTVSRWQIIPNFWTDSGKAWMNQIYEAIGNGVPVYMAKAFGEAYAY